ncbi:MAG: tRNA uridine-5-carboxymethylaminomethyl(34) synthesis GTPase MnmE [Clostridiales bacterium]|nr:tRNA uridine-5-carboxymethylaminomethyl(34) synthesis GTPase MnmE [Clostridiales bacterium]
MTTDTIAAIATAMSDSGIGIIRISGEDAFTVADRMFFPGMKKMISDSLANCENENRKLKKVSDMESHTVHYGCIVDGNEVVDEVLLLIMRAPRTYTREDVVEIDCHGGVLVMKRILELCFRCGARPAEPGEFTKRAFLNGRIDLSQAESVIDVINSKNEMALKSSVSQLRGSVSEKIRVLREDILHEIAFIESALDDPEHYNLDGYYDELNNKIEDIYHSIYSLLISADNGKIIKEGIRTVIVGKPNAGKSSLLNVLIGEERAIVTDVPGTTRDVLEEQIQIGGVGLRIVDTAGIRDTEDIVEKIGVSRSLEHMEKADLIIYVVDSSTELDENDRNIMEAIRGKKAIILLNKSDLKVKTMDQDIKKYLDCPIISVSAKMGDGIDELEKMITSLFFNGNISFNEEVYITNARQKHALAEAEASLRMVIRSMDEGMPEDFLTIDMMSAYEELGKVVGESVEDDLVDKIFSEFCMGK